MTWQRTVTVTFSLSSVLTLGKLAVALGAAILHGVATRLRSIA